MMEKDTFRTLAGPSGEILYKEKNSKFFGYAYPLASESEAKPIIDALRKRHHGAVHFCYAWQLGAENPSFRANDDGEPAHTAGTPIYGQIQSFGLTNVLVVVVRFFGGVKLGAGGLISAYRTAAQTALENADIVEQTIDVLLQLSFDYADMNKVMRIVKEKNLSIVSQKMALDGEIVVSVRKSQLQAVTAAFGEMQRIRLCRTD
jgi:uncharacterized YigZ family protein